MVEKIRVKITLPNGTTKNANLPAGAPVHKLVKSIADKLNLPAVGEDGRPVTYALFDKEQDLRLDPSRDILSQGVREGTALRIEPEFIPGM